MSPILLLLPLALLASTSLLADDDQPTIINGCVIQTESRCPNADLRNADLSNQDMRKMDLGGANLAGANLRHANLDLANLEIKPIWPIWGTAQSVNLQIKLIWHGGNIYIQNP